MTSGSLFDSVFAVAVTGLFLVALTACHWLLAVTNWATLLVVTGWWLVHRRHR